MDPFRLETPKTLEQAFEIIGNANGEVRPLAGGTDLIDQIRQGRRNPSVVLDMKHIPELTRLDWEPDKGLHIGAATSCARVYEDQIVNEYYPSIADGGRLIGSIQIQNRAALGGNVCNGVPSADTVPSLLVYETKAVIGGPNGRREVPLEEFFLAPGKTVLKSDEILIELFVPRPPVNSYSHYLRFIPREEMDIAVVGTASLIALNESGDCETVRIALASVAPTPVRATQAEII
ncbi:xanthine dehydrogenase family protein subunit M [SAR202 cluster bacterium AD-802-E10_MRT_200m]|nr:xanthine dehydrogenase family protein subunit M [SAR202 cluster bacterium AD-802-E10_MRT_200m]